MTSWTSRNWTRNAAAMVAPGKGILAADESTGTIKKRFDKIGLESSFESRRAYRELLFTAPEAEKHISGVILYDETIRQQTADGPAVSRSCSPRAASCPGIKVDAGAKALAGFPGETVTEGLDGLRERLAEYRGLGARFAKWRAVIDIGAGDSDRRLPRRECGGARALRGPVPGGVDRPDRRARSADGRRPHDRALRGSHGRDARDRVRRAVPATACASRAWC